jgi:hypothetical protein
VVRKINSIRRRIEFDAATYNALDRLAKDRMATIQELADEAFRDLLKKHRRPTTLIEMLQESVRSHPANDQCQCRESERPSERSTERPNMAVFYSSWW